MPNLYLATAQGLIRNGVYTPFATPVSIDANYPYTHPNYLNGIQYQIYLLIGTGLTYTVTNLTPTQKEYKLSVIASSYNISALRVLLNDNDTTYDIPVNQITCASEGSPIIKIVRMMPAPGYNDVVQGGVFNTYLPNAKYGCKFTDIVKSTVVDTIVKEIMIDGTKYPINLLPQDTQQIEVVINGLGKGVYQVSYSEPPDTPTVELTVIKTSRDLYHPQAISIVTPKGDYNVGEQEKVRAFEILDAIIDEQFHQPVLWTDDDNCITEEERDALIKKALTMCPNCC
jgi:hypothetical protein